MAGGFDHPDLGLWHQISEVADRVDVDRPIVGRHHDEGRFAPALEEVAIVAGDPVAQPLTGGAPVGPHLLVDVPLRLVRIHPRPFNPHPLVHTHPHSIPPPPSAPPKTSTH